MRLSQKSGSVVATLSIVLAAIPTETFAFFATEIANRFRLTTSTSRSFYCSASRLLPLHRSRSNRRSLLLRMAPVDIDSNDPFRVLGLDPSPNLDKNDIKRAYKRLALKYHPDMTTTKDSSDEEKKKASDLFAKINWAYQSLSGRRQDAASGTSRTGGRTSSNSSTNGWTPPHRRSGAYASSSSTGASTDWKDYIPNYKEETYDTGGDSFGSIFSDLFSGVAAGAGSGAGIFKDFIDFLENNVDGYSSSSSGGGDAELQFLLQTGSLQEIGEEMDETDLVVQQLTSKVTRVRDELIVLQAEWAQSTRYTEKLSLDERMDELRARQKVAENYVQKARKRLLALQTRYKQLIVMGGANDPRAGGGTRQASSSARDTQGDNASSRTDTSSSRRTDSSDSFGSFGRGRGSSRRTRRNSADDDAPPDDVFSRASNGGSRGSSSSAGPDSYYSAAPSQPSSAASSEPFVPPHRRTILSSNTYTQSEEDKRRLRQVKVDQEFDQLKRDLGL
jgi:curved DNA-binding protein CbpA